MSIKDLISQCERDIEFFSEWFSTSYTEAKQKCLDAEFEAWIDAQDPFLSWTRWCRANHIDLQSTPLIQAIRKAKEIDNTHNVVVRAEEDFNTYRHMIHNHCRSTLQKHEYNVPGFTKIYFDTVLMDSMFHTRLWKSIPRSSQVNSQLDTFNGTPGYRSSINDAMAHRTRFHDTKYNTLEKQWKTGEEISKYVKRVLGIKCRALVSRYEQTRQRAYADEYITDFTAWINRCKVMEVRIQQDDGLYERSYAYIEFAQKMQARFAAHVKGILTSATRLTRFKFLIQEAQTATRTDRETYQREHAQYTQPLTQEQRDQVVRLNGSKAVLQWIAVCLDFLRRFYARLEVCEKELLPKTRELQHIWSVTFEHTLKRAKETYAALIEGLQDEFKGLHDGLTDQEKAVGAWRTERRQFAILTDCFQYQEEFYDTLLQHFPDADEMQLNPAPPGWKEQFTDIIEQQHPDLFQGGERIEEAKKQDRELSEDCLTYARKEQETALRVIRDMSVHAVELQNQLHNLKNWVPPVSESDMDPVVLRARNPEPWRDQNRVVSSHQHILFMNHYRDLWYRWCVYVKQDDNLIVSRKVATSNLRLALDSNKPCGLQFYWDSIDSYLEILACAILLCKEQPATTAGRKRTRE